MLSKQGYEFWEKQFRKMWKTIAEKRYNNKYDYLYNDYDLLTSTINNCPCCHVSMSHLNSKWKDGCRYCPLQNHIISGCTSEYKEWWETNIKYSEKRALLAYQISQLPWYSYEEWVKL